MSSWTRDEITAACEGLVVNAGLEKVFAGFGIDSRTIEEAKIYIAIKGDNHDGHDFIASVLVKGIKGLVVSAAKATEYASLAKQHNAYCVAVKDTRYALGQIARFYRRKLGVKIVALTGSAGKTSTRLMLTGILETTFNTWSTHGNFNNDIGVPLTLLGMRDEHEWAVVEMGANHMGEIKRLCEIAEPNLALITNIGPAHLEGFGSLAGVKKAKSEIVANIPVDGAIVLNGDDHLQKDIGQNRPAKILRYGFNAGNDVQGANFTATDIGSKFAVNTPNASFNVSLQAPGKFMAQNALGAIAVGDYLGLAPQKMAAALAQFIPADKRLEPICVNGLKVINDSYNANPLSMAAAMGVLAGMAANRRLMVMGCMGELGALSAKLHYDMGKVASNLKLDKLYLCGEFTENTAQGAADNGMPPANIIIGDKEFITAKLLQELKSGDAVLIKGSRFMQMETIVEAITK